MKRKDMNQDSIDNYLWPNKYMLTFMGFWPLNSDASLCFRFFAYFRIIFSIIAISTLFIPEVLMLIVFWGDILVLTGVGCVTTTLAQLTFKMLYVLARRKSFCKAYWTTRDLWSLVDDSKERNNLYELANQAKRYSIIFLGLCFCNNISFTTTSIIVWIDYSKAENHSLVVRRLPFDVWWGFDIEKTPNFEIIFGCQSLAAIYCCVGIVGLDTVMMSLILHVCAHFRVIRTRLRSIGHGILKKSNLEKIDFDEEQRIAIGQCIEHHRHMIRFAEDVRNLLSPVIFMQLLTSGLEICLSGYAIMVNGQSAIELAKCTGYFLSIFAQLIIWCWPGELLIYESQAIGDVICYDIPWYLLNAARQREFSFIIVRTQKECQITALGFQIMSMRKLTEVFNTAGSYLALLRKVYEKETDHLQ